MSKIPQGEWSAIAARHAQGESLSAIARSYGCTPPAIHYVLKRNGKLPVEKVEQPAHAPAAPSGLSEPHREVHPQMLRLNGEITLSTHPATESAARGNPEPAAPTNGPAPRVQQPAGELQRRPISSSPTTGRALAFADGLDRELHQRAEAAIETFRSCFDAALAEGSPHERARLRQAASDLMRVTARTTIVLDRLNALSERTAARFDPRSNRSWPS